MHMADTFLSPVVAFAAFGVVATVVFLSARHVARGNDSRRMARMAILGAFVFSAQMINFTIPGTGSSGHLAGGVLLAVLLGSHASFLVLATVITMQALFFADGGLLALGANILNLGFFSSFVAYPIFYKLIAGRGVGPKRQRIAIVVASVVSLQMASLGVVFETTVSGISALPFRSFLFLMCPIHLLIGLVEGFVTTWVVEVLRERGVPAQSCERGTHFSGLSIKWVAATAIALVLAGVGSWFASQKPDGLEWAIRQVASDELVSSAVPNKVHQFFFEVQKKTSFLPDYSFASDAGKQPQAWPAVSAGTSLAGLLGSAITFASIFGVGFLFMRMKRNFRDYHRES